MKSLIPCWAKCLFATLAGPRTVRLIHRLRNFRRDVNAFISFCFVDPAGQPLRQSALHRELQAFLGSQRKGLVELPRDHGKSTQVCARLVWELGRNPELRVKIVCASEALAAERGRFLRDAIVRNPRVKLVFPKLHPLRPWTETRFSVARTGHVIGPSVTCLGLGAASTGTRADLLICDDIVDVKAMNSRAERERVKLHFRNNLMNLLEPDGRFWGLCTPWHQADLNAELKQSTAYPLFRRAIGEDFEPIWPERWTADALRERRAEVGAASFARAYRLVPLADESSLIPRERIRYWLEEAPCDRVILAIDPAISTKERADRSALVVLARCGSEIRCLKAAAERVEAGRLLKLIDAWDSIWNPEVILFESNAAFMALADLIRVQLPCGPKIMPVVQTRDKATRVSVFGVSVENGSFRLRGRSEGRVDPSQQEIEDEIAMFPIGEHDDLLDAAAMGTAYLLGQREPRIF